MTIRTLMESPLAKGVASTALLLLVLLAIKSNALPKDVYAVVSDVANKGLNDADLEMQTRNYYREVSDVDNGNFAGLAGLFRKLGLRTIGEGGEDADDKIAPLSKTEIMHHVNPFLPYEFKPSYEMIHKGGHPLRSNRWGMRDDEYELHKPANTFRIALVGASNSMGSGVPSEETYINVLEDRCNADLTSTGYAHYEALNFSVGGYDLTDRLFVATEKIPPFEPDVILVVVLQRDLDFAVYQRVAERLSQGIPPHFTFLAEIIAEAGVQQGDREAKLLQRLRPYRARLFKGCAEELVRLSESTGVPVVAIVLNLHVDPVDQRLLDAANICEGTGLPTLRVFDAYAGHAADEVYLTQTDKHPSTLGHRLIADELYTMMLDHPVLGPMLRGETRKEIAADAP